jgi:hypothetical protein
MLYNAFLFTNYFIQSVNTNPFLLTNAMTDYSLFSFDSDVIIQGSYNIANRLYSIGLYNLTIYPENYMVQCLPSNGFLINLYGTFNYNIGTPLLTNTTSRNIFITMIIEPWNDLYYLTNLIIKTKPESSVFNKIYNPYDLGTFSYTTHNDFY